MPALDSRSKLLDAIREIKSLRADLKEQSEDYQSLGRDYHVVQKEVISLREQLENCKFLVSRIENERNEALARRESSMTELQPIETAPKTGRTLLLGYFNSHGNWRTMRGQWFSQEEINETSVEADDVPNCWATKPTHWMPLPTPPDAAAQIAEAINKAIISERDRICKAIKEEDDHCADGDYMMDSDDCIMVVKGTWKRPDWGTP